MSSQFYKVAILLFALSNIYLGYLVSRYSDLNTRLQNSIDECLGIK